VLGVLSQMSEPARELSVAIGAESVLVELICDDPAPLDPEQQFFGRCETRPLTFGTYTLLVIPMETDLAAAISVSI
jgi:hypothetical protein